MEPYYVGVLRITNPKTLEKWIHDGRFKKVLDEGYIFNSGCGRFRTEVCTCHKCRKGKGKELQKVIDKYYKN